MGYDLHITRRSEEAESDENPILRSEIDQLIESDPELEWSPTDYVNTRSLSDPLITIRTPGIVWNGDTRFWWFEAEITCKNPTDDVISKMISMGEKLNAHVVGDEGERYVLQKRLFGKPKVKIIQE